MIDWNAILLALINNLPAIASLIVAIGTLWKLLRTDKKIDGRLSELITASSDKATAEATVAEKAAQESRKVARARVRKKR